MDLTLHHTKYLVRFRSLFGLRIPHHFVYRPAQLPGVHQLDPQPDGHADQQGPRGFREHVHAVIKMFQSIILFQLVDIILEKQDQLPYKKLRLL